MDIKKYSNNSQLQLIPYGNLRFYIIINMFIYIALTPPTIRMIWLTQEFCRTRKGKKEMIDLTRHSTHFIYGYMTSDIWQRSTRIAREKNLLLPHRLLFPISSKGSFICIIAQTG